MVIFGESSFSCERKELVSPSHKTHLIELYTSEGCSSCPPAEKWVNSLRKNPKLGKDFFPLAFHVDYWDYIGWKDPYAKKEYTSRQRKYAQIWNARNIYTPGFVLNGEEWRTYLSRSTPKKSKEIVGKLKATPLKGNQFKISFEGQAKNVRLNYALLGNGIISKVRAGENRGRTLEQYFVVLEHRTTDFFGKDVTVTIPKSKIKSPEKMVAFWLDDFKTNKPIQVVAGCF
jgi:hypothetical protein